MTKSDIPNIISIIRAALVLPIVIMLVNEHYGEALLVFIVAGLTDAIDGYVAKRYHWDSYFGALLDALADKFLLVATFLVMGWLGQIVWWLVAAVVLRDMIILVLAAVYRRLIGSKNFMPTMISKVNTCLQITMIIAVLLSLSIMPLPDWVLVSIAYATLATTLISGFDYAWHWGLKQGYRYMMRKRGSNLGRS